MKSVARYHALPGIVWALPNLQQLCLEQSDDVLFDDGEDAKRLLVLNR